MRLLTRVLAWFGFDVLSGAELLEYDGSLVPSVRPKEPPPMPDLLPPESTSGFEVPDPPINPPIGPLPGDTTDDVVDDAPPKAKE